MAIKVQPNDLVSPAGDTEAFFASTFEAGIYSQAEVLSHMLGFLHLDLPSNITASIQDPVFVGLDAEWFERPPHFITELGISIVDIHNVDYNDCMRYPLYLLSSMETKHVRIIEHAHMVNGQLCEGHPEDFQFGKTRFVTKAEGKKLLESAFQHPNHPSPLNPYPYRPIVFIGHALSNDIAFMHSHLGVDIGALGTIACTLDTQVLAQDLQLVRAPTKISLKRLLDRFAIKEPYLHNAGNDIAHTLIAAVLLAQERVVPGSALKQPYNQAVVDHLKNTASTHPREVWNMLRAPGLPRYCTRCESTDHLASLCFAKLRCDKCSAHPRYWYDAYSHQTSKCLVMERPRVVIPCEACSVSKDPRRWRKACTHVGEDCYFPAGSASESEGEGGKREVSKVEVEMEVKGEMVLEMAEAYASGMVVG